MRIVLPLILFANVALAQEGASRRGFAKADPRPPDRFPHRIWAACDFEAPMQAYSWFGETQKSDIPKYPGNTAVMGIAPKYSKGSSAIMTGINPVPGPRMGTENWLYLRYRLSGAKEATFQHFSLSSEDNNHVRVSGLAEDEWSELKLNFSRNGRRNDGTPGVPFKRGERMDDLKIYVGEVGDGNKYDLLVDDILFFSNEPGVAPEPEPFPNRVIWLAAFDTGIGPEARKKYWPGRYDIASGEDAPDDTWWGAARSVSRKDSKGKLIALPINPPRQVGARTKLRFRYHITGGSAMTVQIFDASVKDNRHVRLEDLEQDRWKTVYVDLQKDSRRNDGTEGEALRSGNLVDEIFFFVDKSAEVLIDEVTLFDARAKTPSD